MSNSIPTTQVSLTNQPDLLNERTAEFIAKDGTAKRFMAAIEQLEKGVWGALYTPERAAYQEAFMQGIRETGTYPVKREGMIEHPAGLRPLRPQLSLEDTRNLFIGHYGARSEFANGPEASIDLYLRSGYSKLPLADAVRKVVVRFDGASQLAGGCSGEDAHMAAMLGPRTETSHQALHRVADDLVQWLSINADVIPQDKQTALIDSIHHYTTALRELENYLDFAGTNPAKATTRITDANGRDEGHAPSGGMSF